MASVETTVFLGATVAESRVHEGMDRLPVSHGASPPVSAREAFSRHDGLGEGIEDVLSCEFEVPGSTPGSRFSSTEAVVNAGAVRRASCAPTPKAVGHEASRTGAAAEGARRPEANERSSAKADEGYGSTEAVVSDASIPRPPSDRIPEFIAALWHDALSNPPTRRREAPEARHFVGECYPFPESRPMGHGHGRHINMARHASSSCETKAVAIFLPGVFGGVGPCRAAGQTFDRDALFPSLAEELSTLWPMDCYRVSWTSANPDMDEMVHAVCRVALYALTLAGTTAPVRVILVGHSYGGAVVFPVAVKLREMLASTNASIAGVIALSPQPSGASQAVAALEGVPTLFIHSLDDRVLRYQGTVRLHASSTEPKELELLRSGGHGLREHKALLQKRLRRWIISKVGFDQRRRCT
mmetsp:Transcript_130154/g.376549  ORF Transcript_130154/g.376549 Transcript_130154/m.376549 type:complete len:413 (+) Transcript_130154:41-1279(+)